MISFLDGPAAGVVLVLNRLPLFIRVVEKPDAPAGQKWDALDLLDDAPASGEVVHVYERVKEPRQIHIRFAPSKGRSGWYWVAEYRHHPASESDRDAVRETKIWQAYAVALAAERKSAVSGGEGR